MASITFNINNTVYSDKVKPTIIEILHYETRKLENETEDQFVKRMLREEVNNWFKSLYDQKLQDELVRSDDVFDE